MVLVSSARWLPKAAWQLARGGKLRRLATSRLDIRPNIG